MSTARPKPDLVPLNPFQPAADNFFGVPLPKSSIVASSPELAEAQREVLEFLRPKPHPAELIRLGGNSDGAYLLPNDLTGLVACFSPGVKNKKAFEDELAKLHGIPSFMCDKSSDEEQFRTPLIKELQHFRKAWLDTSDTEDSVTLENWVGQEVPGNGDLLLQMDIEGAEYRVLMTTRPELLRRFRILVLEFHGLQRINDASVLLEVLLPTARKLATDFVCIHAHANNASAQFRARPTGVQCPRLMEVTLLRKDRFPATPSGNAKVFVPHPLDIPRNARGKPPIFLDDWWLGGAERPLESQLKMAQDETAFLRYLLKQQGIGIPR